MRYWVLRVLSTTSLTVRWEMNVENHQRLEGDGIDFLSCLTSRVSPSWCQIFEANAVTANNVIENGAVYDVGTHGIGVSLYVLSALQEQPVLAHGRGVRYGRARISRAA